MSEDLLNMPNFNVTVYKEAYYYNVKADSAQEAETLCLRKCFPNYETAKAQRITYKESQKLKREGLGKEHMLKDGEFDTYTDFAIKHFPERLRP